MSKMQADINELKSMFRQSIALSTPNSGTGSVQFQDLAAGSNFVQQNSSLLNPLAQNYQPRFSQKGNQDRVSIKRVPYYRKCPKCTVEKLKCSHCFICGDGNHQHRDCGKNKEGF